MRGCRNKHVYPVKDIGQIVQHCNPVHVLHVLDQWGVVFGNFLAQITQASEDLAPGQSPDLGVQQQLVEVSTHLIAEDGEETGIHARCVYGTADGRIEDPEARCLLVSARLDEKKIPRHKDQALKRA
ncbi:hypothetical protein NQZ68_002361 [Dissostichus eleginoides]|nr:hypothetical protein NQZ68_002361 [Dissostichus eleginoides]